MDVGGRIIIDQNEEVLKYYLISIISYTENQIMAKHLYESKIRYAQYKKNQTFSSIPNTKDVWVVYYNSLSVPADGKQWAKFEIYNNI